MFVITNGVYYLTGIVKKSQGTKVEFGTEKRAKTFYSRNLAEDIMDKIGMPNLKVEPWIKK